MLQRRLTKVLEGTTDLVGIVDAHGRLLYLNSAGRTTLGIDKDEDVSCLLFLDFLSESLKKLFQREASRTTAHGTTWRGESLFVSRDGREIPVWLAGQVHRAPDGTVEFVSAIARDITERKLTEEALRESEDKFRIVAEQSPNMIFINKRGRIAYASELCEEVTGYTRSEFYSEDFDFLTLIAPGDRELVRASYRKHTEGEEVEPYEYSLVTKDGNRVEVITTTRLIDYEGERAILGTATDITERRQVEEALRQRNRRLALLNQASQAFSSTLEMDQVLAIVLEEVRRMLGAVAASIWLIDPGTDEIVCRQATGPHHEAMSGWRLASGEGLAGWVAHSGEPLIVPDTDADERHFKGVDQVNHPAASCGAFPAGSLYWGLPPPNPRWPFLPPASWGASWQF